MDLATTDEQKAAVEEYREACTLKSDLERQDSKEKTGVFTGSYAVNPVSGEEVCLHRLRGVEIRRTRPDGV